MLHDVVEDSEWTLSDLREAGFSPRVVDGVDGMTSRVDEGELYFDFIRRVSTNSDSIDVKLNDLHHNLSQSRNNFLPEKRDFDRIARYVIAYNYLIDVKKRVVEPGRSVKDWMEAQDSRLQDFELLQKHSTSY
eukprot:m.83460 g.83460  ORF g.83460 m.83460 type:complete len:133 (-) comp16346_c0_seq1:344-742(-)